MAKLLDLPTELDLLVFGYLPSIKDALHLSQTCSKLFTLFHDGYKKAQILHSIVTQDDAQTRKLVQDIFQNRLIQAAPSGRWQFVQGNKQRYVMLAIDFDANKPINPLSVRVTRSVAEMQHLATKAGLNKSLKEVVISFVEQFAISEERLSQIMTNEAFEYDGQFDIFTRAAKLQLEALYENWGPMETFDADDVIIALALDVFALTKHWQEAGQNSPMRGLMERRDSFLLVRAFVSLNPKTAHPSMNLVAGLVEDIERQTSGEALSFGQSDLQWKLQTLIDRIHHIMLRRHGSLVLDVFYALDILMYCSEVHMDVVTDWLAPVGDLKGWLDVELANLCALFVHYAKGFYPLLDPWLSETSGLEESAAVKAYGPIILDGYRNTVRITTTRDTTQLGDGPLVSRLRSFVRSDPTIEMLTW